MVASSFGLATECFLWQAVKHSYSGAVTAHAATTKITLRTVAVLCPKERSITPRCISGALAQG